MEFKRSRNLLERKIRVWKNFENINRDSDYYLIYFLDPRPRCLLFSSAGFIDRVKARLFNEGRLESAVSATISIFPHATRLIDLESPCFASIRGKITIPLEAKPWRNPRLPRPP